jgi:hypothetical protein
VTLVGGDDEGFAAGTGAEVMAIPKGSDVGIDDEDDPFP